MPLARRVTTLHSSCGQTMLTLEPFPFTLLCVNRSSSPASLLRNVVEALLLLASVALILAAILTSLW